MTPKWYEVLCRDPRWPQRDDRLWIEDVENTYIAKHGIDLDHGRVLLAEAALCAYEWLQTDKGQAKKPRGLRTFWLNWVKREGDATANRGLGKNTNGNPPETDRERRRRDADDLQRRIAVHQTGGTGKEKLNPRGKGKAGLPVSDQ